jgi:gamma-glutamyltranspeptidase / glutathione hydrolase
MVRTCWLLAAFATLAAAQAPDASRPVRHPERGLRGAVAAGGGAAADAGMRLFHAGGNAVDAGVAAMLAAAVTEFSHFGFGGEAPILVRTRDGQVRSIAGVGTMPALASAGFFRNRRVSRDEMTSPPSPRGLDAWLPVAGILPALVPGMVEAALVALREYGTKPFSEVAAPAIDLAGGWPLDETRAAAIARSRRFLERWPASRRVFLPGGRAPIAGEILRQPDLARTLRAMADAETRALAAGAGREGAIDAVRDFFYRGDIARRIDRFSRENEGLLRYEDMAAFRLEPEDAVSTGYRGYEVHKPGFWSQGPAMVQALDLLEGFDLRAMGPNSAGYIHTLAEALKLAYADRDAWYGDPRFVRTPARLLSKDYAAERRKLIGPEASLAFRPGEAGPRPPMHPSLFTGARAAIPDALMARDTTCVAAIDAAGLMFSATPSGAWLPSVIAGDTGIPLTQRAQSFLLIPGHPNELAPGKRPRITLSPTLVTRGGAPYLALTTPGGDNQDQALLQVLLNVLEFGRNAQQAVEAPRFQTRHLVSSFDNHAMEPGDLLLDERIPPATAGELGSRGHRVGRRPRHASGAAPVIVRVTPEGAIEAGADPWGYRSARAW